MGWPAFWESGGGKNRRVIRRHDKNQWPGRTALAALSRLFLLPAGGRNVKGKSPMVASRSFSFQPV
jgi:hypothetical protein